MKRILILLLLLSISQLSFAETNYESWDKILKTYVCDGGVNYNAIKKNHSLLSSADIEFKSLSEEQFHNLSKDGQLAWLINLYNFYTIKLIVENLPLKKGIRDISKPWDQNIVPFVGKKVSLNHIEHQIIRKEYNEPGIHFALVCASIGCPPLSNELFTEGNLSALLEKQGKVFLNDTTRNRVEGKKLFLSEIFSWYGGDFKEKYGSYKEYVIKTLKLEGKYSVKFIPYDWSLNSTDKCGN